MGQSKKFSIQLAIKFSIKGDQLFKFAERFGYPARAFSLKVFLDLQPCDVGAPSFRDVQCSGYNNWIFPEDGKLHQWSEYKLPEGNCLVNYSSYLVIKSGKWESVINLEISKLDGALYLWNIYIYFNIFDPSLKLICVNLELCLFNFQIDYFF